MKQKLENLPAELKEQKRFTPALEDKRPAYPAGVSWNDSANWWNLDEVKTVKRGKDYKVEAPETRDWITWKGAKDFVMSGSQYVMLDFDHVLDSRSGKFISREAETVYQQIKESIGTTYTEKSMSGSGLHILLKATENLEAVKGTMIEFKDVTEKAHLEIWYGTGKKFTLTGDVIDCKPCQEIANGVKVDELIKELLRKAIPLSKSDNLYLRKSDTLRKVISSEQEEIRAIELLQYIEPSRLSYEEWLSVGMALKNVGCSVMEWERWSRSDSRYKIGECEKKWASFTGSGITIGTLYRLAETGGYVNHSEARRASQSSLDDRIVEKEVQEGLEGKYGANRGKLEVSEYLEIGELEKDVEYFQKYRERGTGYTNIDEYCKLYPGLYVIGAVSSLGKTTFMHQMADQLAQNGERVLYVSYEQSRFELISKGLSRLTYLQSAGKEGVSSLQIRAGATGASIKSAITTYKEFGKNEVIIEADFDYTIDGLLELVKSEVAEGRQPIVIIDYLQVIAPSKDKYGKVMNTKEHIDNVVKRLKSIQRDYGLVVFLISSLNRQNYMTQIDFESFKESGGIEYTADVVYGMQLAVMKSDTFKKDFGLNDKREAVKKAKAENPRKIELVCLKNRYSAPGYSCWFKYYAKYDLFEVDEEGEKAEELKKNLMV